MVSAFVKPDETNSIPTWEGASARQPWKVCNPWSGQIKTLSIREHRAVNCNINVLVR